jgi:hypothetical protein
MLSRLVRSVDAANVKRVEVFGLMLAGILSSLLITKHLKPQLTNLQG